MKNASRIVWLYYNESEDTVIWIYVADKSSK